MLTWCVLAAGLTFAATVIALRYWVLPSVGQYRDDIARIVSERAGQKVSIARIHANWDGLRPQLVLEGVTVHDAAGRPALELSRFDQTLSWLSLATLELRFHSLDIHQPRLNIRRDARGVIAIAGVEMSGESGESGFADWLLRQRDIEIHDATLVWSDELRGAQPLELRHVYLQMFSQGGRHRFGVRAVPPAGLAGPIDLRGDVRGRSFKSLADWRGRLFVQLDYADIAAWRAWLPFPVEFPQGAGALRAWLNFSERHLDDVVADLKLANVRTRLASDLPELDLTSLTGRLGWRYSARGFEITTSRLRLATAGGLVLPPADFLLRITAAGERRPASGELSASALELAPLVQLADHLPIGHDARKRLAEYSPSGGLHDLSARWTGDWREPRQFSVRGRFRNLGLKGAGRIPGFAGISGNVEATERGGTLVLNSQRAVVDMPLVFRDRHEFDALTAQVSWTRSGGETALRLENVSFSNRHLAGNVFGNYRTAGSARGIIDLTGNLGRADARYVGRYIPLVVGKGAREWLDKAFLSGHADAVTLRVKGNLDEFPFPDGRGGVFQVTAKVGGGTVRYADDWPKIENIAGDIVFRGRRMDIYAREGTIMGVRLSRVRAEIPDLTLDREMLGVAGDAEGATRDFFAFMAQSPVLGMIDRFTENWEADGRGRLALKLAIPLRAPEKTRIQGAYQFSDNSVTVAPKLSLSQASGRVEFTESTVTVRNATARLLGGPVTIGASTSRDATVRVTLAGRIDADNARRNGGPQWLQHMRGATGWRAVLNARSRDADFVIESDLKGLAVNLPAPAVKAASEAVPLRFERRVTGSGRDRLLLTVGEIVGVNLVRRVEGERATITHGTVHFGGAPAEPERAGVWISGAVKYLDLDRWLGFLEAKEDARVDWGGVNITLAAANVLGRPFGEIALHAVTQPGGEWRGNVTGRDLEGTFLWQPQGARGRIVARMKKLAIPRALPGIAAPADARPRARTVPEQLPVLDITAERFSNKGRDLGKLELAARPDGQDWRIERLRITNPESVFTLNGAWQLGLPQPRTQVSVRLEASDVGKLLTRLGYPEGVRRGTSKLEGALAWTGAPYDFDYPTLSGNLVLEAAKGQFVKLEPGIGKLLGILSLQALPRRISLDFRDVFSEGFAFDDIVGAVKISQGVASTENLRIQGPAARIAMSGAVNLAEETQKLKVRITPHVSDTLSIAGALVGGPIAGVATFLAQKVLKDPLDEAASYEYSVTGTWAAPAVVKLGQPAATAEGGRP